METYTLTFTLQRDATFGRGDGVPGLVNREVAHDEHGFPYLHGRALKGMLVEECDLLLDLIARIQPERRESLARARSWLFGRPGSLHPDSGALHISHAELPENLRKAVLAAGMPRDEILASLTAIRRQSAIEVETEAPAAHSLRASRVVLRETPFQAALAAPRKLDEIELALLAASVLHWRRAGSSRNRGRGRLVADVLDPQGSSVLSKGLELVEVPA